MGLNFMRPYLLLLIPLLIGGVIYSSRWLSRISRAKRRSIITLRSAVLSLLVLSLSGMSFTWKLDTVTTFFLIDASDSARLSRSDMESFIKEAESLKGPRDKVGVISFGENSQVESFISGDIQFSRVEGKVNGNYTNIENAVTTALSLFPANTNKRIVLISDGEENSGAVSKIAPSLSEQGIDFKYYSIEKPAGEEAAVESISVPQRLTLGEEFNVIVTINSTSSGGAKINLFSGREKAAEMKVQLQKGTNKFVFKDKALTGGFKSYKVTIEPDKDSEIKNNEASAFTNVVAKPKVLVIEDTPGEGSELEKLLKASSVDYNLINAASAPRSLAEMTTYKSIITCNVSADNLNDGFLNSLESYVKDFGGGFIATGGDNSFALGGYMKTPIEKVLPVNMEMKGKKEIPKMAMILIIDKSGSMTEGIAGISKVDMAKEAAIRSLGSLRAGKDEIGVLSFDQSYSWAVKRQVINDVGAIEDDIGSIRADGGTSILPALKEGYESLKKSDAKLKHIILLTDGQAERTGYEGLLKDINKDNITVSTVAVGKDADKQLLQSIAEDCGGRCYITDEYTNIPRIFSKETFMAARTYLNNREFTPVIANDHMILKGVSEGGLPALLGYVGASQKETARIILKSDEDDPILTVWQYGLGKTAAWNSDISGKWSANYIPWDKNIKLWQNLINFTLENYDNEDAALEINAQGNSVTVVLKDKKNEKEMDTSITVVSPSGENKEIKLYPTAPGQYEASMDLKETGVYMINGKQVSNGEVVNSVNTGYAVQYSPEYRLDSNQKNISKLVLEAGGKLITKPNEVFTDDIVSRRGMRDLTAFLLEFALILFMFDIAVRRLNINTYKLKVVFSKGAEAARSALGKEKTRKPKKTGNRLQSESISAAIVDEVRIKRQKDVPSPQEYIDEYEALPIKKVPEQTDVSEKGTDPQNTNTLDTSKLLKSKRFKK